MDGLQQLRSSPRAGGLTPDHAVFRPCCSDGRFVLRKSVGKRHQQNGSCDKTQIDNITTARVVREDELRHLTARLLQTEAGKRNCPDLLFCDPNPLCRRNLGVAKCGGPDRRIIDWTQMDPDRAEGEKPKALAG